MNTNQIAELTTIASEIEKKRQEERVSETITLHDQHGSWEYDEGVQYNTGLDDAIAIIQTHINSLSSSTITHRLEYAQEKSGMWFTTINPTCHKHIDQVDSSDTRECGALAVQEVTNLQTRKAVYLCGTHYPLTSRNVSATMKTYKLSICKGDTYMTADLQIAQQHAEGNTLLYYFTATKKGSKVQVSKYTEYKNLTALGGLTEEVLSDGNRVMRQKRDLWNLFYKDLVKKLNDLKTNVKIIVSLIEEKNGKTDLMNIVVLDYVEFQKYTDADFQKLFVKSDLIAQMNTQEKGMAI